MGFRSPPSSGESRSRIWQNARLPWRPSGAGTTESIERHRMADVKKILSSLGLKEENPGVWASESGWLESKEGRSEEHTSELQSRENLVCRLLLEKKKNKVKKT